MKVHTKKFRTFSGELRRIKRQVPYLIAKTLNDTAFFGRSVAWPQEVRQAMNVKNAWTMRSMRVVRATSRKQVAVLGSVASYMKKQEKGHIESKKGEHGVPIPAAAPATRLRRKRGVGAKNRIGAITTIKSVGGGSPSQSNAIAIQKARKAGGGVVFLQLNSGHKGLYRVTSSRKPRKLWDLSKPTVTIPKNPTLEKASHRAGKRGRKSFQKRFFQEVAYSARKLSR